MVQKFAKFYEVIICREKTEKITEMSNNADTERKAYL